MARLSPLTSGPKPGPSVPSESLAYRCRAFFFRWHLELIAVGTGIFVGVAGSILMSLPRGHTAKPSSPMPREIAPAIVSYRTIPNTFVPPGPAPAGMVWIPGGEFAMGSEVTSEALCAVPGLTGDSQPVHRVYVDGFWMDRTEVTNEQFAAFVAATGYVTMAERKPTAEEFPDAPPENLVAGSVVFTPSDKPLPQSDLSEWWSYVPGANWRHPLGPQSDLFGQEKYPVVHVTYADAAAYAAWARKRLPTEAEWEFAARGGLEGQLYVWGNELTPAGKWMANIYEGTFPARDSGEDDFAGLAPVAQFPANGYGLFDMAGNVWEWCSDWYQADTYGQQARTAAVTRNPRGPTSSFDPAEPSELKRVQRGGSFLCTDQYCARYLVGTRGKGEVATSTNNVGFRCVRGP